MNRASSLPRSINEALCSWTLALPWWINRISVIVHPNVRFDISTMITKTTIVSICHMTNNDTAGILAEWATLKRLARTFWPFQPWERAAILTLGSATCCVIYHHNILPIETSLTRLFCLLHFHHVQASSICGILWPSSCSANRMTSDTGSVPGERMKINGVVLTFSGKAILNPLPEKHVAP